MTRAAESRFEGGIRTTAPWPGIAPICLAFGGAFLASRACGIAVAPLCVALAPPVWGLTVAMAVRRREPRATDLLLVLLLLMLGYGWGAPSREWKGIPAGLPSVPVKGRITRNGVSPVASRLEIAREGIWRSVPGCFLARGADSLGDGAFAGRGFLIPAKEPRLPGLWDPSLRLQLGGLRGRLELEEGWPVGPRLQAWRGRTHGVLGSRVGRSLPAPIRSLIPMLVWGESGETDPELLRVFRATGTMHLVAISGLHVSLIALLIEFALRLVVRRADLRVLLSLAGLAGYTALVGPMPSVVRSSIMAGCILVGRAIGRPGGMEAAWWSALLTVVVATPADVASPGMQLSFSATAALLLRPRLPRRWDPVGSSYAATAATSGILWAHFGETAPLSIAANLIGIPAFTPVLIAILWGLAWGDPSDATLQAIAWGPARVFAFCWIRPLALLTPVGEATIVRFSPGPAAGLAATFLFLASLAMARRASGPGKAVVWLIGAGLPALLLPASIPAALAGRRCYAAEALVLPVGQGDATLLRTAGGADFLFDTGPGGPDGARGRRMLAPALRSLGVRRLRGVFLSHGDEDHVGGLRGLLLSGIGIDTLYVSATAGIGRALPRERFPPVRALRAGWSRSLGEARIAAFWPPAGDDRFRGNDGSLVLCLDAPGGALLLPGDLGHAAEESLAAAGDFPGVAVLLAGHHGSAGSSGEAWCARVHPRLAFISCGARNRHGHPTASALARLRSAGAVVHRTDREGTLALRWHAGDLWFRSGGCGRWKPVL
jgi:competence protein ComEC